MDEKRERNTMLDEMVAASEARLGITHRDGIPWHEAPIPRRLHRCTAQTTSFVVDRCACGAVRTPYGWTDKNSRRGPWWKFGRGAR